MVNIGTAPGKNVVPNDLSIYLLGKPSYVAIMRHDGSKHDIASSSIGQYENGSMGSYANYLITNENHNALEITYRVDSEPLYAMTLEFKLNTTIYTKDYIYDFDTTLSPTKKERSK